MSVACGLGQRARTTGAREVAKAQPEHHRSADTLCCAQAAETRSTSPISTTWRSARERRLRPSACWAPIDLRLTRGRTGRGSRFCASACRWRPEARPSSETSDRLWQPCNLRHRGDAAAAQLARRGLPHSPQTLHRERPQERAFSRRAESASSPSGFASALATFARNLVRAIPTVIGRPTSARTSSRSFPAISAGVPGCGRGRVRQGRPRRSRGPRRLGRSARRSRRHPCSPACTPTSAVGPRSAPGTAGAPGRRPSQCALHVPSPRSSPRGSRRRRRRPDGHEASAGRAAQPMRRRHRGRREGSKHLARTHVRVSTGQIYPRLCAHGRRPRLLPDPRGRG